MGKVYIVGAGPGSLDYLTVRGQYLLNHADVLVYDALVDDTLLREVPAPCLKLDVGKRGGKPSTPQTEINHLLVKQCQLGQQVVRLKSGDPFIFGRTTSEIQALIAADCPFEIVPGVSSALAAPLLAGIPLTEAVMSRCFAVLTGHDIEALDWEALTQLETLVILMGGQQLDEIIHQLHRHGRSLQTPIAIIRNSSRPDQEVWIDTLANITHATLGQTLSPAVIVIGEVVRLRDYLQSPVTPPALENRDQPPKNLSSANAAPPTLPLTGKTILVTRSAGQSSDFTDLLQQQGATVIELPALVIKPPSSWEALDAAIEQLSTFNWLILTSSNGVDAFFERLNAAGKDARALGGIKIAVVGKKTAASLQSHAISPDFIPPDFVADSLIAHFPEPLTGSKILFPRVETGGREVLVQELTHQGAVVVEAAAYESGCPDAIPPLALKALQNRAVDIITFASSKTVQNFDHLMQLHAQELPDHGLEGICIASIGPQTSKTCQTQLGRLNVEAKQYTLEGLTQALIDWVTNAAVPEDVHASNR